MFFRRSTLTLCEPLDFAPRGTPGLSDILDPARRQLFLLPGQIGTLLATDLCPAFRVKDDVCLSREFLQPLAARFFYFHTNSSLWVGLAQIPDAF